MSDIVCDFCTSPDVRWRYRAPNFTTTVVGLAKRGARDIVVDHGSWGDWAACPACHALIEAGDRKRLVTRSARRMVRKHPSLSMALAAASVKAIQDQFFLHRSDAPPLPVGRP